MNGTVNEKNSYNNAPIKKPQLIVKLRLFIFRMNTMMQELGGMGDGINVYFINHCTLSFNT